MKTLTFFGLGDDLFCYEVNGSGGDENYNSDQFLVIDNTTQEAILVFGRYAKGLDDGTWMIGVAPFEDRFNQPTWNIWTTFDRYTSVVHIVVPDHVEVRAVKESLEDGT